MKRGKEQPEQLRTGQIQCLRPYFLDTFAQANREDFLRALENGGISLRGQNITALDFGALPTNMEKEKMMSIVQKRLEIDSLGEEQLANISLCFRKAKEFITDYLNLSLPAEIAKTTEIRSEKDLWDIIKKSEAIKGKKSCGFGPYYCMVLSIMLAEWEHLEHSLESLHDETEFLYNSFFERNGDEQHFHIRKTDVDRDMDAIGICDGKNWINAQSTYRGKTECSVVAKIAKHPGYTVEEIIKDGIGLKFEVQEPRDIITLLPFLVDILKKKHSASDIKFENINCLKPKEVENLKNALIGQGVGFIEEDTNASSSAKFKTAKIRGKIEMPKGGGKDSIKATRTFEVQINLANNENETGLTQSAIYKRVQKLSIVSRLLGSFPEEYLDLICREASGVSQIEQQRIKKYIIKNFLYKLTTSQSKKPRYCSKEHVDRWKGAGIMPEEITTRAA